MFFNVYPYTNFHELNLDEILRMIHVMHKEITEFEALNKITFSGAWDITKQYPAWTIVNDSGAGYISIRPVPAGVLLTDNTYWRGVVDYTATIADLQNRVINCENDILNLQNDLADLATPKYVVMVGDSYLAMAGSTIADDVANGLGFVKDVHAVSAMGFVTAVAGDTFINLLDDVTTVVKDKLGMIITYGGINDYNQSETDIYNAVVAYIAKVKTDFPGIPLVIIGPQASIALMTGYQLTGAHNAIMKACLDAGVPFADGRQFLRNCPYEMTDTYISDYTHPSALGMKIIASKILGVITGNDNQKNIMPKLTALNSGDFIAYTVQPDGIEFRLVTASRTFTQNTNQFLFEAFNISPEVVPNGRYEIFDIYSMASPDQVIERIGTGDLYRVANTYIRGLWIPATTYTGRIAMTGKIHFFENVNIAP